MIWVIENTHSVFQEHTLTCAYIIHRAHVRVYFWNCIFNYPNHLSPSYAPIFESKYQYVIFVMTTIAGDSRGYR